MNTLTTCIRSLRWLACTALVGLVALPGCAAEPDAEEETESSTDPLIVGPEWSMVTLVFKNLDVDYLKDGVKHHAKTTMTAARIQEAKDGAAAAKTNFSTWNNGRAFTKMTTITVDEPIKQLAIAGGHIKYGYWIAPNVVSAALDKYAPAGKFDSVFVVWDPGAGGADIPACCAWGRGPGDDTNGMTYASVHPNTGGEGMIHEWLHGAGAFYRGHGLPVPDPHENRAFGYPSSINGSWKHWYIDMMRGNLLEAGKVMGYTSNVWRSGTPRKYVGGSFGAPPIPSLAKPVFRKARVEGDWIYLEWDAVRRPTDYSTFITIKKPDGSNGPSWTHYGVPGTDRGDFDYFYVPKSDVCAKARAAGVPLGAVKTWAQVWPDKRSTSAASLDVTGTFDCR